MPAGHDPALAHLERLAAGTADHVALALCTDAAARECEPSP